ncbi:MAG: hypothetical protein AAGD01_08130 [Acidobacteriota bacterium]
MIARRALPLGPCPGGGFGVRLLEEDVDGAGSTNEISGDGQASGSWVDPSGGVEWGEAPRRPEVDGRLSI